MRGCLATVALLAAAAPVGAQNLPTFITSPLLTMGDSTGAPMATFNRLTDARRLSDGRIVAAVCGDKQLRSYDASGKHLATRSLAESPGPQRILVRLFPGGGDTLVAFESINGRLSMITPDLSVVRTVPIPNPDTATFNGNPRPSRLDVIGRFDDGTFLGRLISNSLPDAGIHRRKISFYRFDNTGKLLDSLAGLPGPDAISTPGQRGTGSLRLGRFTVAAVLPDRLVVGDQAGAELAEYGPDLRPARRVSTITRPVPVTDSIRAAWTAAAVARTITPMNGVISVYVDQYPETTPAFRDLVAGTDGRLWVQDPTGADFFPLQWTAYRGGRPVARAELPPRFYPTQFGPDWVLGLAFDTTTVERVQLLRLAAGALPDRRLPPRDAAPANRPQCGAWISR